MEVQPQNNFVQVPIEDLRLVKAQSQQSKANAQHQAQILAELRTQQEQPHWELAQQQTVSPIELANALTTIQQLQQAPTTRTSPSSYSLEPNSLRAKTIKFMGCGDNTKLWLIELESNFRSHCYLETEWGELIVSYLNEGSRSFWYELRSAAGGLITDYPRFL